MAIPLVTLATVVSQDPDKYGVNVSLSGLGGGQMPALPVQVITHGPRDAIRGAFPELPLPGQTGIVIFPRGDSRNGMWIGSYSPGLNDSSTHAPGSGNIHAEFHYAGGFHYRGQDGTTAHQLADGTQILAGAAMPALTRHTVDGQRRRVRTTFTAQDRQGSPVGPMPLSLAHPTGATAAVSSGGAVTVMGAPGQTVAIQANGATILIDGGGDALVMNAGGASVALTGATATVQDGAGLKLTLSGGIAKVGSGSQFVKLAGGGNSINLKAD